MFLWRLLLKRQAKVENVRCGCSLYRIQATAKSIKSIRNQTRFHNLTWTRWFSSKNLVVSQGFENKFAFNVVNNCCSETIPHISHLPLVTKLESGKPEELTSELVQELQSTVNTCSDSELLGLLTVLGKYRNTELFDDIWKIVDDAGAVRVPNGKPSIMLAGALTIHQMELHTKSVWVWSCLKRFCRRMDKLSTPEVCQNCLSY